MIFQKVMGSTPVGEQREFIFWVISTWECFFIYFTLSKSPFQCMLLPRSFSPHIILIGQIERNQSESCKKYQINLKKRSSLARITEIKGYGYI